jgi:hypothetical protein
MPLLTVTPVLRWITARLLTDSALAGYVGSRVENEEAEKEIAFPYVLISILDPGIPIYLAGARAVATTGIYLVRGVINDKSYGNPSQGNHLEDIATRIVLLLHGERGVSDPTAGIISSTLEQIFTLTESKDNEQYRHLGGSFRISAQT